MTSWNQGKILVTGAGGFIGSHLVEKLVEDGARVRAFVRYNSRGDIGLLRMTPSHMRDEIEIIPGDLRDMQAIQKAVDDCSFVFHLGAMVSIPYSYFHPREVTETNILGTLNILLACQKAGVERIVHTSTSEVYGTARQVPISEEHPLQGQSPYSASKIGADKLAESFYCAYNLPVVTVRPFNTFGPRQSARAVIPTIITQALSQSTIKLGNLDTTRDFTYVSDTVNGFIRAALSDDVLGKTYNLGTGQEIKIGMLAQKIINKIGNHVEIKTESERMRPGNSEVFRLISDNSKALGALDWRPEIDLDKGLDLTIGWIKDNLNLYKIGKYEF